MWEAVRWLHLLAMAFFVGGQLVLAAAVVPAFRGGEGRDREPLRTEDRGPRADHRPMDRHEQLIEHLGLGTALTPEQAAEILVGAAGYARDALRTLERCTDPALGPVALRNLNRRAVTIESHLRALYALAVEHCDDDAVREIPIAVGAHLELASKCRSLVLQRSLAVDQELLILRSPLPQYRLPC